MQCEEISAQKTRIRPFWKTVASWFRSRLDRNTSVIPAHVAYCKATYGINTDVDTLIKLHQRRINSLIRDKTSYRSNGDTFADYRCVYSFPKDITPYIERILIPFEDNGYTIINISDKVDELSDDNVYLLSWYKDSL